MVSTIGLKIANGEFYSILEENSPVKKRLVLTTVHDNQRSVQIDLYKSYARSMADAQYIGSLVMEKIKPRPKGEPSIELVISSANDGEITADAVELDTSVQGEHHVLNVSLESLNEDNREFEIPDFELEQNETPPTGLLGKALAAEENKTRKKFPWLIVLCILLILLLIGLAVWLFVLKDENGNTRFSQLFNKPASTAVVKPQPPAPAPQPVTPQPVAPQPVAPNPAPVPAQTTAAPVTPPPPVIQAPAQPPASAQKAAAPAKRNRITPPVASYRVPSVIPKEGVPYTIRWGDTLWDISEAFYRNPWLYPRIARFNNIRNPDLIISGTTIRVPPRN